MTPTRPPDRPQRRKSRRPERSAATATPVAPDAPVTDDPPVPAPEGVGAGGVARAQLGRTARARSLAARPPARGFWGRNGRELDEEEDARDAVAARRRR